MNPKAIDRYRANLQGEIDSLTLYLAMAEAEPQAPLAELYRRLAKVEEKHADFWERQIREAGAPVKPRAPTARTRIKVWLARRFGPGLLLPSIAAAEQMDQRMYDDQPESARTGMPQDERSHARVLGLMAGSFPRGLEGSALARIEGRHRAIGGNALRAAVLGANDGLLSNLSLVMGVSGAHLSSHSVLVTGIAGLLAGAFSMAIGEWISVQSSRELNQFQIATEADELAAAPEEEEEELALIYEAKGLPPDQAKALARRLISDPAKALDTLTREELGIDPKDLGGSPWVAAMASFVLFAVGAVIPVAPFLFSEGTAAVRGALLISAVGLFGIGAGITLVTGRSVWVSGIRQLLVGLAAAGVTYGIGHFIGVQLSG
ncbi:MAG: rubrerythrin family protein [Elusimicrobia bacterium RIFCSPLOWO2_01_FULL_59_12]|nr:MAG: rubrerythrin family protein [Elusimicrobia bacterium RIFCSPLOWO2_01_FULL_59_12]